MSNILLYLLKVLMSSGILFAYYWFFLRNKQFHQYNRFYLLFITFFSWIVPVIEIKIAKANALVVATLPKLVYIVADSNSNLEQEMLQKSKWLNWDNAFISIALIISFVFIQRFIISLYRVYKMIKRFPIQQILGLKVILSEKEGTPFSFFEYIFWNTSIDLQSESGKKILAHEVVHAEEYHSLDKLIIEFNLIIGWFNPFFWFIRNELYLIHEFIADSKSIQNNDTATLAELLLAAAYPKHHKLFLNHFFFSPIKRRLAMLSNQQKIKYSYIRRVSVLPITGIIVLLFAFKNADKLTDVEPIKQTNPILFVNAAGLSSQDTIIKKEALNKVNSSNKENEVITINSSSNTQNGEKVNPLYVLDGEMIDTAAFKKVDVTSIASVNVIKGKMAMDKYGEKGKNGVIEITSKVHAAKDAANNKPTHNDGVTIVSDNAVFVTPVIKKNTTAISDNEPVFNAAQVEPQFPGGANAWLTYLDKNLDKNIAKKNKAAVGNYTVNLRFTIDKEGNVSEVIAENNPGFGTAAEAIRVIENGPRWIPAEQNGKKVIYSARQTIVFQVK